MAKAGNTGLAISIDTEILKEFKIKCIRQEILYSSMIQLWMQEFIKKESK